MKYGLKKQDSDRICGVFRSFPKIDRVILYGSRAKGNYRPHSDIDLTLVGAELNYQDLVSIDNHLDDLLLPYTIDLSLFHQIDNPELIQHIERVGQVFYATGAAPELYCATS